MNIYEMKLHEKELLESGMLIMRVPGGWIYIINKELIFLPLNSEFEKIMPNEGEHLPLEDNITKETTKETPASEEKETDTTNTYQDENGEKRAFIKESVEVAMRNKMLTVKRGNNILDKLTEANGGLLKYFQTQLECYAELYTLRESMETSEKERYWDKIKSAKYAELFDIKKELANKADVPF